MKSNRSATVRPASPGKTVAARPPASPQRTPHRGPLRPNRLSVAIRVALLSLIVTLLASCSAPVRPERLPSNQPPSCGQRTAALDSGDPPADSAGGPSTDWMAWAQAYVRAQWAIVDRDNKRAATADCVDDMARIE